MLDCEFRLFLLLGRLLSLGTSCFTNAAQSATHLPVFRLKLEKVFRGVDVSTLKHKDVS